MLNDALNIISTNEDAMPAKFSEEEAFKNIFQLLRLKHGVDFTYYKQTTIRRRILRRMVILKQEKIVEYLQYIEKNNVEVDTLFHDLLIPVTSFFRDPEIFESLCKTVLPELVENIPVTTGTSANPLRIWIVGCSTGQEVYSIAICLHEYLSDKVSQIKIQIFATDISEKSIGKARSGLYDKGEMDGLTDGQVQQFFTKINGTYQVKKAIRDMCVFACHNFLKDPPFAKIDLISCRNVLIYMEPFLQKKAFTTFHYSLKPKGYLWLGKSKSVGSASDYFVPLGPKEKIYSRKAFPGKFINTASTHSEGILRDTDYGLRSNKKRKDDFQKDADDILLLKYTPPGVIVNDQYDIVQFRGSTGDFLEPAPGKASLNVLKMAREGLSFEIRNALQKAKKTKASVSKENIPLNNGKKIVSLEVIPLLNSADLHFLILFKDAAFAPGITGAGKDLKNLAGLTQHENIRIKKLEKDLVNLREDMRSITEDQEAANEELQSANEELLSGSEELQSLNEELETGKEESQSTNEELVTVNQELFDRNEQYNEARIYAEAIVSTIHEPLIVIDRGFRIKSANQSFYKNFSISEQDTIGKTLFELQNNGWDIPGLRRQLLKIQSENEKLISWEDTYTFPLVGKRTICFNAQPVQKENGEGLILLAMEDITHRAHIQLERNELLHRFQNLVEKAPVAICLLRGKDYVIEVINEGMFEMWDRTLEEVLNKPAFDVLTELRDQGFKELLDNVYNTGERLIMQEIPINLKRKGKLENVFVKFVYEPLREPDGTISGIMALAHEITEQVLSRKKIEESEYRYHNLVHTSASLILILKGEDLVISVANDSMLQSLGKGKDLIGKPLLTVLPEIIEQGLGDLLHNVFTTGESSYGYEVPVYIMRNGKMELSYYTYVYAAQRDLIGEIDGVSVIATEVTPQAEFNKKIKESEAHFRQVAELMPTKITNADAAGGVTYYNKNWLDFAGMDFEKLKDFGYHSIMHPGELEEFKKRFQIAFETGTDLEMEMRFMNKDGEYIWHLNRASPVKDESGQVKMWIGATTDIHNQKTKEDTKDEFISIASHELKTPLTIAKAYIDLLQINLQKTSKEDYNYAQKAAESIDRLNGLIGELLDVSKIQNGKLGLKITEFDFNEMISTAIEGIQYASPNHTIHRSGIIKPLVKRDKERLQQVVINLLSNAVKYSPNANVVDIHIAEKNGEVTVAIKDKGIGISKENVGKIFERYYREEGRATHFQGLGIGLYISYEIVQRHNGTLWVESKLHKGSTFYFKVPINYEAKKL